MKKYLLAFLVSACVPLLQAENLSLVTLLSQPIGSFSTVNLLDPGDSAQIFHLNFSNNATMNLSSLNAAALEISSDADLIGTVPIYQAANMHVDSKTFTGGSLEAGSVIVQALSVSKPAHILVSDTLSPTQTSGEAVLYAETVTSHSALFNNMTVTNRAVFNASSLTDPRSDCLGWSKISCATGSTDSSSDCDAQLLFGKANTVELCKKFGMTLNSNCECQKLTVSICIDRDTQKQQCIAQNRLWDDDECKCKDYTVLPQPGCSDKKCTQRGEEVQVVNGVCTCVCVCSGMTGCGCIKDTPTFDPIFDPTKEL